MKTAQGLLAFALAALPLPAAAVTLDEAITAALRHAPEIAFADADAGAAKARLDQAEAARLPTAAISGTYGYGRLDPKDFFGLGAETVHPRAAQATIEQPLFTGGRVSAGIAGAKAGLAAREAGRESTRSRIVADVARAYGDVLAAERMTALHARLVDETTEIVRQAQLRFRAGESPSTDVSQATARLAEARAGLARAEGMKVSRSARFRNLTGLDAAALEPLPGNPSLPATLDEAMDAAKTRSPMLAEAEAGLRAAEAAARGARAERLPTVGAFAEAGTVRDQFFPDYRADSTTVGVRARWELFSGGRVSAKISEATSEVRAAEARKRAAEMQIEEAVIAAFQEVHTARLVETAAEDQAEATEQALASVRHEVRVGMKPQLDLLDAEREALGAGVAAVTARTDRIVAAYRLLALIGGN
jgi:outer membrane protein